MENRLLTTLEVAERLGVHRTRVNVLIKEGRLPATRYGKSLLVQEADLALVLDRKAGRPKKEPDVEIAPTTKAPAKRTAAPKAKGVATKKGEKK